VNAETAGAFAERVGFRIFSERIILNVAEPETGERMKKAAINPNSRRHITLPAELHERLNSWVKEKNITPGELARRALCDYLEALERDKRNRELTEACKNYREFNKQISSELARVESRL
jgi:hypothetical protein